MRSSLKRRQRQVADELSRVAELGKLRDLAELMDSLTSQPIETKEETRPQAEGKNSV
jgi:hypothetical protein